ncbi:hypothetical protein EV127DRAFT_448917 [Xylaria flabelliformis]|nr:hypothetical protein EV127DRAFT_448917 [Xylaria flabelliformis]
MGTGENPFIRFKNTIDNNVRRGRDYLFGSPPSSTSSAPTSSQPSPPSSSQPSSTTMATVASESEQTTTMAEVHTWSIQSPYSPLNLQDLPQPTPRDAPPRPLFNDANINFTFRDAFEDLLVAGSGQPLPSMHDIVMKKRREIVPFWEASRGLHVTSWVGRLASRGLWDAYFRMEPSTTTRRRSHPYDEMDVERQLYFRNSSSTNSNRPEAPLASAWPGGEKRRTGDDDDDDFGAAWTGAWDKVIRRATEVADDADPDKINSALDDAKGVLDAIWKVALNRDLWKGGDGDDREKKAADVEEELYSGTTSSSTTTSKLPPPPANNRTFHWDQKKNEWQPVESPSQQEGVSSSNGLSKPSSSPAVPEVTTTVYADGSKYVKTTSRIERNGKTKVTTTAQHFDPAGNLVSERRESSTTRTWSGGIPGAGASLSWSWNNNNDKVVTQRRKSDDNSGGHDEDRRDVDDDHQQEAADWSGRNDKEEKKGWFWNR